MDSFFTQVFTLLTTPPGNLVYRVILAFSVFGALQMSARHWQDVQNRLARRMAVGLGVLLGLQLGLFIAAGLGWQNLLDAHKLLPVLMWGATLLSILWLIWLWAFPESARGADAALGLLTVLIVTMTVFGIVWWTAQNPILFFNGSWADQVASLAGIGLSLIGFLILAVRRPLLWGYGLASMLMLFLGCLVHWLFPPSESDYAGIVRLAEMAVYPLLLALPQRLVGGETLERHDEQATSVSTKKSPLRNKESDPKLLQAFLSLAGESDISKLYQGICRIYSQLMVADLCLVALPPDAGEQIMMPAGYDLITDRLIDGFAINTRRAPLLTNVLRRGRNLRLPSSSTAVDPASLAEALGVKQAGHILAVAVAPKGSSPLLSIVLLSPYSNRAWSAQDQQYLINAAIPLAGILQRTRLLAEQQQELEKIRSSSGEAQVLAGQPRTESEDTKSHIELLQMQFEQERARATSLAGLVTGLESKVTELEVNALPAAGTETATRLQEELHLALTELAELKSGLARSDLQHTQNREIVTDSNGSNAQSEMLASIAQELRRPVSSIIGYTDLLLGESVGLLGAMQRKFLERVKASTERMGGLLDELITATTLENGGQNLHPTAVDLNAVIDEALAAIIANLSERNIALRVDLPDDIPQLRADRDALLQILTNLLQNAGMVTPVDGEIWLRTRVEVKENEPGYVLIQVTDSGGGIPPESLPRVFSRLYRSDNQSVQGVGDNGVGLAIVKTLVEAHGGRIWVDSEMGRGATYSVLLPLVEDSTEQVIGGYEG
jgi:signal transduction histidine kinase